MSRLEHALKAVVYHSIHMAKMQEVPVFDKDKHFKVLMAHRPSGTHFEQIQITPENQYDILDDPTITKRVAMRQPREEFEYLALCELGVEYLREKCELDDLEKAYRIYQRQVVKEIKSVERHPGRAGAT